MDQSTSNDSFAFPRICTGVPSRPTELPEGFQALAETFESATGWVLSLAGADSKLASHRQIHISDMSAQWPAGKPTISRAACDEIAEQINQIFRRRQSNHTGQTTTKNTVPAADSLAKTVRCLLAALCKASQADSGVVCLLDDPTENLVARYQVGQADLLESSRVLKDCEADVEALCGSAIVMKDRKSIGNWGVTVNCSSAVCLPIATNKAVLGTVWLFSDCEQEYSLDVTNLIELVAGLVAQELEQAAFRFAGDSSVSLEPSQGNGTVLFPTAIEEGESSSVEAATPSSWVQPPFAGWSVAINEDHGYANWAVTADEQIVAVAIATTDFQEQSKLTSLLQELTDKSFCDSAELLKSVLKSLGCDGQVPAMVAVIDPLIGEVQLSQTGCGTLASLLDAEGKTNCIKCSFACFMSRGFSMSFHCKSESSTTCHEPQLTISRS